MFSQQEINLLTNPTRQLKTKIQLLDWNENVIDEIQGVCVDGNISIDVNSAQRYTGSITTIIKDRTYIPKSGSKFWLNRKTRIFIGLNDYSIDSIFWWDEGIYIINKPVLNNSSTGQTIQFELCNQMAFYDGTLNGSLLYVTNQPVEINTPISTAIKSLMTLGGCNKFNIDIMTDENGVIRTLPYTLKKEANATIYECIKEIGSLYMGWNYYFSKDGYFCFKKILNRLTDTITYNVKQLSNVILKYQSEPDWVSIKNHIEVWGKIATDGTQSHYVIENIDENSPFSITNLGQQRNFVVVDDTIFTQEQAILRGKYELIQHSNFNEKVVIECAPLYNLDGDMIIDFEDGRYNNIGIVGKYLTQKINYGLKVGSTMNIELTKLYDYSVQI